MAPGTAVHCSNVHRRYSGLGAGSNFVLERMNHPRHSELIHAFQNGTEIARCFWFSYRSIRSDPAVLGRESAHEHFRTEVSGVPRTKI